jgi:hypothetical protein
VFFAIGAIDLVVFVVAAAAILLLLAGDKFFQVIAAVLGKVPVIGGTIASTITQYLVSTMQSLAKDLEKYTVSVGELSWGILVSTWHVLYRIVEVQVGFYDQLLHVHQSVHNTGTAAVGQANAYTDHAAAGLSAQVAGVAGALEAYKVAAAGSTSADLLGIDAQLSHLADEVQSEAATVLGQADAFTASQVAQAEALANALADSVQSEAVTLFGQAEGAITVIQDQVQALPGLIEGTIPGIIDGIVPGIIAGAIPGILAQVIPRVATLEAEADECLKPLCDTVTPNAKQLGNLGQLFKNLEALGLEALFIALAAEAAHDPGAVAHDIVAVVDDVGGGLLAGFRDLVGV